MIGNPTKRAHHRGTRTVQVSRLRFPSPSLQGFPVRPLPCSVGLFEISHDGWPHKFQTI
jgi:hypothetical protein